MHYQYNRDRAYLAWLLRRESAAAVLGPAALQEFRSVAAATVAEALAGIAAQKSVPETVAYRSQIAAVATTAAAAVPNAAAAPADLQVTWSPALLPIAPSHPQLPGVTATVLPLAVPPVP